MNVRVGEKLDIYCPQSSNLEEPLFLKVNITSGLNRMLPVRHEPPFLPEIKILKLVPMLKWWIPN